MSTNIAPHTPRLQALRTTLEDQNTAFLDALERGANHAGISGAPRRALDATLDKARDWAAAPKRDPGAAGELLQMPVQSVVRSLRALPGGTGAVEAQQLEANAQAADLARDQFRSSTASARQSAATLVRGALETAAVAAIRTKKATCSRFGAKPIPSTTGTWVDRRVPPSPTGAERGDSWWEPPNNPTGQALEAAAVTAEARQDAERRRLGLQPPTRDPTLSQPRRAVRYTGGYPDFSPYVYEQAYTDPATGRGALVTAEVTIDDMINDDKDFGAANRQMELRVPGWRQPSGWTWHHNQDTSTMQLVPAALNLHAKHMGGASIAARTEY